MVIVATGKYVGEGFDCPRLDALFLTLPVSWKGIVAQYAGRLHREYEGKKEVLIYDYVDIHVPVCEVMYRRRLKGYAAIGYSIRSNEMFFSELSTTTDIIYDGKNFIKPFVNSLSKANQSIVLACPKIKLGRFSAIVDRLCELASTGIVINIFTKEENDDVTKLRVNGINVNLKPDISFNCCVIDKKDIWYGSVNFLGYQSTEDNVITFHDAETAKDILELLYK